jgi:hypothetical protein
MRSPSLATPTIAAALTLLAACANAPGELPLGPAHETAARAPAGPLAASNGGGASVDRFPNIQFLLIYDAESQLLSAHMPSNICGDGEFNVVDVKRVRTPSPVNSVSSVIKDEDSQAAIYRASSPAEAGLSGQLSFFGFADILDLDQFCAFMSGPQLVAEGTVQSISTFSAASFHVRRTGVVQGVDGQDYHLTEVYQLNADAHDPNNPDTFVELISSVSLSPAS